MFARKFKKLRQSEMAGLAKPDTLRDVSKPSVILCVLGFFHVKLGLNKVGDEIFALMWFEPVTSHFVCV